MNTPPFLAISSLVSRHPAILHINLGAARCTEATSAACSTSTFSKHANTKSATFAINLVVEGNQKAPRPVEAAALLGNTMDDTVMRVITRVEQTFSA